MLTLLNRISANKPLLAVIIFIFITNVSVLLNIPVLRQFTGFVFLTFLPGYLILKSLRQESLGIAEKIALSVGISVSFIMLFGLVLNYSALAVGFTRPLTTVPILISFSVIALILAFIAFRGQYGASFALPRFDLSVKERALLIVPALFPLMSIIGMRIMNTSSNNIMLIALLLLIPAFVVFAAFYQKNIPERLYPTFVFLIGISILLLMALRSNHVLGSDIHDAFYFFQTTLQNQYWSMTNPGLIESLLSISLLPTVYKLILSIQDEYIYKLLFSLLFSITPMAVYIIANKYLSGFFAFLATFFFMSQVIFLWTPGTAQTNIAIMVFTLAVMTRFGSNINEQTRRLLFMIFAASSVVSHYSTSYIFFLIIMVTWFGTNMMNYIHLVWMKLKTGSANAQSFSSKPNTKSAMSVTAVLLFAVIVFLWHAQITGYTFDTAFSAVSKTFLSMQESLLLESKGSSVTAAFGQTDLPTIPQQIKFISYWAGVLFVAGGGLITALKYKESVDYPGSKGRPLGVLKSKFELEYFVLSAVCGGVLILAVILPLVSVYYSLERTFLQILAVLSSYLVVAGIVLAKWLKMKPQIIILPILIVFFLSITGAMYDFFGIPSTVIISSDGQEYQHFFIEDTESSTAKWLRNHWTGEAIQTDYDLGPRILASQGHIPRHMIFGELLSNYSRGKDTSGYLFLFYPSVVRGEAELPEYAKMNIRAAPEILVTRNQIFSAGTTEIFRSR